MLRRLRPAAGERPGRRGGALTVGRRGAGVAAARPAVGRTRTVEILRGGRSKVIRRNSYDGLPLYGAFAHVGGRDVLARVDALLAAGRLRSSGGRFPKLCPA